MSSTCVSLQHLDLMAAEAFCVRARSLEKGGVSVVHVIAGCR
jgi:hypothetical protein